MKETRLNKEKQVKIKCNVLEDGSKQQEIYFDDGSQIKYITFTKGGKMKINGDEFEMPEGTVVETKSVNGRVFSQLIQTPDMQRNVINKPEYLDRAAESLTRYIPASQDTEPASAVMPTPEYILNLLGKANSARTLLDLSKTTRSDEKKYLERSITEGKLPENISITGVTEDGGKILTIPMDNCKYEVCGSEMRVIDNDGVTKMIARYESGRESQGLWVVLYDDNKPITGSHYVSWSLDRPLSTVLYKYNSDSTVSVTTIDAQGNESTVKQVLPEGFCLAVDKGFKFVSPDKSHLGSRFENQTPYCNDSGKNELND